MDLGDADLPQSAESDGRAVDPPIPVESATWTRAGQLDWWVRDRQEWWGRVGGADGRQRWIRAVDLRRARALSHDLSLSFVVGRACLPGCRSRYDELNVVKRNC
jgi:hypothetical protein